MDVHFFSGTRPVSTGMRGFAERLYKLQPSCPDNNLNFGLLQETPSVKNKAGEKCTNHFREQQVMKWNEMKVVQAFRSKLQG